MASSSDNQGLQIAVIIFALLTIVMSGATFYVFKLSEDAELRAKQANEQASTATAGLQGAIQEIEQLRKWCGLPDPNTEKDPTKLEAMVKRDMELYGGMNVPEDQRNYRALLANNFTTMKTANEERTAERAELQKLADRYNTLVTQIDTKVATHKTEANTASDQLATRTQAFDDSDKKHVAERNDLNTNINQLRDQVATLTDKMSKDAQKALQDITLLQSQREGLQDKLTKYERTDIHVPDGSIRWVSAGTRTVWIDVGRADNVRRQTTFGVWGVDENGVARGEKKASIEVTQVLGEHLAEARIIEDEYTNPILIGDKIYTPLWDPKEQTHFAICGDIDVDGDNKSDLQMIRDLIASSGGVLDAELLPDGKMQGELSVKTRYLILGMPFVGKSADEAKTAETGFGKMQKEAKDYGAQVISAERFLDQMGWKDSTQVVNFGRDSDPKDFNYNPPLRGQRPAASREESEQFRRRPAPPSQRLRSAYDEKAK